MALTLKAYLLGKSITRSDYDEECMASAILEAWVVGTPAYVWLYSLHLVPVHPQCDAQCVQQIPQLLGLHQPHMQDVLLVCLCVNKRFPVIPSTA